MLAVMSNLFRYATEAARRAAKREFARSPMGRIAREVGRVTGARGSGRRMKGVLTRMASPEARRLLQDIERVGGGITRYGAKQTGRENLNRLLQLLGPLGNAIRSLIGAGSTGKSFTDDQFGAATEMIRAFGGEVLTKPGIRGHKRGVEAAKELLAQIAEPPPIPEPQAEEWPEEHMVGTLGRGSIGYDEELAKALITREHRVESSNVYSFVFEREGVRTGILYVTFLAWSPGVDRRAGPGSTYAYYDVPLAKYNQFARAAASSAGKAVWDYLRVRGSIWEHQHTYRIVGGTLVQGGGQYVPRKATQGGYRKRAVTNVGVGRRGVTRSTLPERRFRARKAEPNRAAPNRGN